MRIVLTIIFFVLVLVLGGLVLSWRNIPAPETIRYGATFSVHRAEELRIDWRETYEAMLTDLGVSRLRLVAHWDMVEPEDDQYNFSELDYQMRRAEEEGAEVILAVGRRLPSWPECHEPYWIDDEPVQEQREDVLEYITQVVNRYKDSPALKWWQVENEPFIIGFAYHECEALDIGLLDEKIALVRSLDPDTPILMTASGELGLWDNTWIRGDVFGTTLYRYVWSGEFGMYVTYPTTPGFYRAKRTLTELTTGEVKPAILAELSVEPWLSSGATVNAPVSEQLERMSVERMEGIIDFAARTSFDEQYLWGVEWWYYLKTVHGNDAHWEWGRKFFNR